MTRRELTAIAVLAAFCACPAFAADESPSLQEIMQDLRDALVTVTDGLLTGQADLVTNGATAIAAHADISPAQVQIISRELAAEMAAFQQLDALVHEASTEIASAAGDPEASLAAYRRMLDGCFACHSSYKARLSAVLHPAPSP